MADQSPDYASEYAQSNASHQPAAQRPSRARNPAGFYRIPTAIAPVSSSKSDVVRPRDGDRGKRKRLDSLPKESASGNGRGGVASMRASGLSGKGKGRSDGSVEAEAMHSIEPRPKSEEARERTPPSECEARESKKDSDVKIKEDGPQMEVGDKPRFYAKVVREIEVHDKTLKAGREKLIEESYRMPDHPPILLPAINLGLFRTPDCVHVLPEREIVRFAMGPMVLPLLKQWAYMWLNQDDASEQFHADMQRTFPMHGRYGKPWASGILLVAEHAARRTGFTFMLAPLLYQMSGFARRLVNSNGPFFDAFSAYSKAVDERQKFAARMLLVVWEDVEADRNGFFGTLMKSELARPSRPEVRSAYEGWYVVDERLYQ